MSGISQLKAYRNRHDPSLSQAELAERLGVSRLTVNRWERGVRSISPHLVPMISQKTGIPAKELRPDFAATYGEADQ